MQRPKGQRFSDLYRERGEPIQDSDKLRRRIAHKLDEVVDDFSVIRTLRSETGHRISGSPTAAYWLDFTSKLSSDAMWDFLTDVVRSLIMNNHDREALDWIAFCTRALDEENIAFEMDEHGGIHYRIDEAFQSNKLSALRILDGHESLSAREAFEEAHAALSSISGDTLTAVRRAFDAVESIFKMKFGASRLGASEVKKELREIGVSNGGRASDASRRINDAFAEWINACHQYRHASAEPEPSPPPRWLAVTLVDSASIYLRYLAS